MRILGIDHGTVRVGLALSDELGMLAYPLETVGAGVSLRRIVEIVQDREVQTVVVGMPLRMDGTAGPAAERVGKFLPLLRSLLPAGVEIVWRDESLTTVEAHEQLAAAGRKAKDRRGIIDQAAAVVILQEYLDERRGPSAWLATPEPDDEA